MENLVSRARRLPISCKTGELGSGEKRRLASFPLFLVAALLHSPNEGVATLMNKG